MVPYWVHTSKLGWKKQIPTLHKVRWDSTEIIVGAVERAPIHVFFFLESGVFVDEHLAGMGWFGIERLSTVGL